MKILYDISILGRGHAQASDRTGIFRVIENLAVELVRQPECDITFCTNTGWQDIRLAMDYLEANPIGSQVSFSAPVNFRKLDKLKMQQTALVIKHGDWRKLPFFEKTLFRIQNKQLELRQRLLNRSYEISFNPQDLKNAAIYHSHFLSSFNGIKEAGIKSLFLTSYDIIPVLYPQYCRDEMPELMISILSKLTPDHWVVCISEATRNDLLNYMGNRLDPAKVKVTELAASDIFYQSTDKQVNQHVRNKYGVPDAPYILSLCTLEPRKNIDQAIRAFVQLIKQEHIANLNLVLVGPKGWKFEKIFGAIEADEATKKRIYITGYLADEDLAAMYSDALMFVYPSFYEGFGLPPLEAMQCGVPVITSNTSSLPEVVGDAGIMVAPTDLDALCQAMLSIYQNPQLHRQMVQKSLIQAGRFSWKRCAEKTADAYKISLLT